MPGRLCFSLLHYILVNILLLQFKKYFFMYTVEEGDNCMLLEAKKNKVFHKVMKVKGIDIIE